MIPITTATSLESTLARIEREIRDKQYDISCLQAEFDDLQLEREALIEQLEEIKQLEEIVENATAEEN
jgi:regulator of replication initiation timing